MVIASRLGVAEAAITELDLVIQRLETNITDVWNQALLAHAAAATVAAAALANIQAPEDNPPVIVRPQISGIVNLPLFNSEMPGGAQPQSQAPPPQRSYREAASMGCRRYAPDYYRRTANRITPRYQVPHQTYYAPLGASANAPSTFARPSRTPTPSPLGQ